MTSNILSSDIQCSESPSEPCYLTWGCGRSALRRCRGDRPAESWVPPQTYCASSQVWTKHLGDSRTHDGGLKNLVDFDPRHLVLSLRLSVPILLLAWRCHQRANSGLTERREIQTAFLSPSLPVYLLSTLYLLYPPAHQIPLSSLACYPVSYRKMGYQGYSEAVHTTNSSVSAFPEQN